MGLGLGLGLVVDNLRQAVVVLELLDVGVSW